MELSILQGIAIIATVFVASALRKRKKKTKDDIDIYPPNYNKEKRIRNKLEPLYPEEIAPKKKIPKKRFSLQDLYPPKKSSKASDETSNSENKL